MHCARHVAVLLTSELATEAHQVRGGGGRHPWPPGRPLPASTTRRRTGSCGQLGCEAFRRPLAASTPRRRAGHAEHLGLSADRAADRHREEERVCAPSGPDRRLLLGDTPRRRNPRKMTLRSGMHTVRDTIRSERVISQCVILGPDGLHCHLSMRLPATRLRRRGICVLAGGVVAAGGGRGEGLATG